MTPLTLDDAQQQLAEALTTGDADQIAAASARVDHLDPRPAPASLHAAALWYASIGLPVFPLQPGTKIPMKGSRGCKDATTDTDQVNAWWTTTPEANIGLATGHVVDIVDIDGPTGQQSRAKLWDSTFGRIDADAVAKVLTPRKGGMHLYVPATGDGNGASICDGVDYRGRGGYVVAPPSRTDAGAYRFLGTPNLATTDKVA